jgi:DNA-binding NarL/FixJ family response regulator
MESKTTIIIAEDHPLFIDGLKTMLNLDNRFKILAEAENGDILLKLLEIVKPDLILMDINMPILNGIDATKFIATHFNDIKVIALTMNDERSSIMEMMDAGANGYILKSADREEIMKAINTVMNGDDYYCKRVESSIINLIETKSSTKHYKKLISFNDKEIKIINFLCEELNSDEIAKEMYLSKKTIDGIRIKIKNDLNVRNSIGIVKYAIRNGIFKI